MKFWLPVIAAMLVSLSVQAENYRVVYSPSLALEVFIDNVQSKATDDWCKKTLPLRIVSGNETDSEILATFLPRVGTLLANQCAALSETPWILEDKQGNTLAHGNATRQQEWRPVILKESSSPTSPALSHPASPASLTTFALPDGCHFRTIWHASGLSLFIPALASTSCSADGWLEGSSELVVSEKEAHTALPVRFFHGYPLANLRSDTSQLQVVNLSNERIILGRSDAPDSWLVLPFDAQKHLWHFDGTLLIKADSQQAPDAARLAKLRSLWETLLLPQQKISVSLVNQLEVDQADPAANAWRKIN